MYFPGSSSSYQSNKYARPTVWLQPSAASSANCCHSLCLSQVLEVVGCWLTLPTALEVWHIDELVVKGQASVGSFEDRVLWTIPRGGVARG
jgi:hypothetical protein